MASEYLEHKLTLLPAEPGCYMMKNVNSQIIYVGKAKNLRSRVRSYFKSAHEGKTAKLVSEIVDALGEYDNDTRDWVSIYQDYKRT